MLCIFTRCANRPTTSLGRFFRALADPTRLRLLNLIAGREICVSYFVEILKTDQPKISRHLGYLRRAGIVAARRQGKWMYYRLEMPRDLVSAGILREIVKRLRSIPEMRRDLTRLRSIRGAPERYRTLGDAPPPGAVRLASD